MLRSPIVCVLGHVDHGKTTFLDKIRETTIALKEPGAITQSISSTFVPRNIILKKCSDLMNLFHFSFTLPGLLFIDTPGHKAFVTMRERGGSIADIAVLIIDINEGIMPQTKESIKILKTYKTPFVIALNKIDKIKGWISTSQCFLHSENIQKKETLEILETKLYEIITKFNEFNLITERFDRIEDFSKQIAIVPISAKTGEGIADLLTVIIGLAEKFLKEKLITTKEGKGIILDVKQVKGLGTTIDVIMYDGIIEKDDFLVIGEKKPLITKIRALLQPKPLKDIKVEKDFIQVKKCIAATGVKIVAPNLENVRAGLHVRIAKNEESAKNIANELKKIIKDVEIKTENEGLILKANSIGTLEALINVFNKNPIREAKIGMITKEDVLNAMANKEVFYRVVIGFNVSISPEADEFAKSKGVKLIVSNIIYKLEERFEKWKQRLKEKILEEDVASLVLPAKLRILPGCVFRSSKPAIVGCEISGTLKSGVSLFREKDCIIIGKVKQIQQEGVNKEKVSNDRAAISIDRAVIGRQIKENDILYVEMDEKNYKQLLKYEKFLSEIEKYVLEEIVKLKRKINPSWGL